MENIHAVYNGRFNFLNDIKISPLSRAYTFSDSVYEVIPFCNSNIIEISFYGEMKAQMV